MTEASRGKGQGVGNGLGCVYLLAVPPNADCRLAWQEATSAGQQSSLAPWFRSVSPASTHPKRSCVQSAHICLSTRAMFKTLVSLSRDFRSLSLSLSLLRLYAG